MREKLNPCCFFAVFGGFSALEGSLKFWVISSGGGFLGYILKNKTKVFTKQIQLQKHICIAPAVFLLSFLFCLFLLRDLETGIFCV